MKTYEDYRAMRHLRGLDGLRTISVILVLSWHTGDALWRPAHGYLGVTLFFVISGFLITTLLLREESSNGGVSIWRFYVRRAFRILPLYYLMLAVYVLLVVGLGMAGSTEGFWHRFVLLGTLNGEFVGAGWFSHGWSLGIEEKFYLVWPVVGFAIIPLIRHRLTIGVALLALAVASAPFAGWNYLAIYVPILGGAILAILMHKESTFRIVAHLAHPLAQVALIAMMVFSMATNNESTFVHIPFAILAVLAMPSFVLGRGPVNALLNSRPIAYMGRRSYGIYLVHIVVLLGVSKVLHEGGGPVESVLRLAAVLAVSTFVAELLFRILEAPMGKVGHRLAARPKPEAVSVGS